MRGTAVAALNVLLWWGLLFLLYVILISSVSPLELMVGAGFALLGAAAAEALRRAEHPRAAGGLRLAAGAAAFPLTLLRETGMLAAAVAAALSGRPPRGRTTTVRLAPGTDPALAAGLLSASPGACVIDITAPSEHDDTGDRRAGDGHDGEAVDETGGDAPTGATRAGAGAGTGTDAEAGTGAGTRTAGGGEKPGRTASAKPGRTASAKPGRTPANGRDLTVHLLGDSVSPVERALGGRRLP